MGGRNPNGDGFLLVETNFLIHQNYRQCKGKSRGKMECGSGNVFDADGNAIPEWCQALMKRLVARSPIHLS